MLKLNRRKDLKLKISRAGFVLSLAVAMSCSNSALGAKKSANSDENFSYNYASVTGKCQVYDPYESFNRKVFKFNGVLDAFVARPMAKIYGRFTNDYTKDRVGSFTSNISEPLSFVNYLVQGKPEKSLKSFWRFAINSTIGIGGIFDVASKLNLKSEPQTFGNTLAHYGVGSGPYIVLPIFGGTNARGITDSLFTNNLMNPVKYVMKPGFKYAVTAASIIHTRHEIMPFTDYVSHNSPDPYIAVRDAILQQQEARMDYPDKFVCPKVRN